MTYYDSPQQAAFFARFAAWTEGAVKAEWQNGTPILRANAASQAADEPASKFLRALTAAGDEALAYWQGWRLVSLGAWGMAPGFDRIPEQARLCHRAMESLYNQPSPSHGRLKPSPARARTAFMKRLFVTLRDDYAVELERVAGGEWRFANEVGNARIVSRFDTGAGSHAALRYEIDCYDRRYGLMYRGISPLSWLCVSACEWNDVEIDDGVPLLQALRVNIAAVNAAVEKWLP